MWVRRRIRALLATLLALMAAPVLASGPGYMSPWYLDEYGGDKVDLEAFYAGRVGVVMPTAPRPMLFMSWRLLHRKKVGAAAGEALAVPCCGDSFFDNYDAVAAWLKTRSDIPGASPMTALQTGPGSYFFTETPNCFPEAFHVAAETLTDRARRFGGSSPAVKAWLAGQDVVFAACSSQDGQLPPAPPSAPAWLRFDRGYQQAALALYSGRNLEAAKRFDEIAKEAGSPWRASGLYLAVRADMRQALQDKSAASFARAEAAVSRLAAAPSGTFGQGEVRGMRHVLAYRERPKAYFADLAGLLDRPELGSTAAVDFRDFVDLGGQQPTPPAVLDWIATLKAADVGSAGQVTQATPEDPQASPQRARAHALARWAASRDSAWLIAAMSLTNPGEPGSDVLASQARTIGEGDPAWLSVQYHLIRLTIAKTPAGQTRRRLDAILARQDLSVSDRNLFMAQRTQVAVGLRDFERFALRWRLCADTPFEAFDRPKAVRCVRADWLGDGSQPSGLYDGAGYKGVTGFGEDARAIIDRAPLAIRLAISADARLPRALRLDVALTSFGFAVGAQDNVHIDQAARQLLVLLPLLAPELRGVLSAKPGPDKRFAEFFVLAKDPGIRPDLDPDYARPEGRRVVDFQSHWADWVLVRTPSAPGHPPSLAAYQTSGTGAGPGYGDTPGTPDALTDLSCLGECGEGASPLRLPDFVAAERAASLNERRRFAVFEERYDDKPQPYPAGGVAVWDEMLEYCRTHPSDPRVPEALHWLVHVGHFGGSHNHSGHRAFKLLQASYAGSYCAKKTRYYDDGPRLVRGGPLLQKPRDRRNWHARRGDPLARRAVRHHPPGRPTREPFRPRRPAVPAARSGLERPGLHPGASPGH